MAECSIPAQEGMQWEVRLLDRFQLTPDIT